MADINIEEIVRSVVERIVAEKTAAGTGPAPAADLRPDASASDVGPARGAGPDTTTREVPLNRQDDVKRVAVGSDRAGLEAKAVVKTCLESAGYTVVDVGAGASAEADYPGIAAAVARKVASGECERGIVLGADGIGPAVAANKVKGVRAALCYDMRSVINSREHVNANVMALGGPIHGKAELCEMAKAWLQARFPGGKRWESVNGIMSVETRGMR